MTNMQMMIKQELVDRGMKKLREQRSAHDFAYHSEADSLMNNIEKYPHHFVFGCVMDRQIPAKRAWLIPYQIGEIVGGFEFSHYASISEVKLKGLFQSRKLHRFNEKMASAFYLAVKQIAEVYGGDASRIWSGNPASGTVVKRFLDFNGVGPKIASMAANILVREFKIPMSDHTSIDVSPDVQVKRVFARLGLIKPTDSNEQLQLAARILNPEYPGVFDYWCWRIGQEWCRPNNPHCDDCFLSEHCQKVGVAD